MLDQKTSPSLRFRPRRHDAGAALMMKFRRGPAGQSRAANRHLRIIDALHTLMLTMICFTAAIVLNDDAGERWSEFVNQAFAPKQEQTVQAPGVADGRTAPAAPEMPMNAYPIIRLTLIEEEGPATPLMARPATLSTELRVAEEQPASESPPSTSQAARQPLRAALNLGEQAMRALRR